MVTGKLKHMFPEIKTQNLILRQFKDTDISNVFKGLSHPDVVPYYGVSFSTLEETKEQMNWFSELYKSGTGIWWAVCDRDSKEFFGGGGFNNLSKTHKKAEIGFWLLPENWRKGVMKEAMPVICNYGFEKLGLHRIEGFVETENANCIKAMRKLRFELEGTMRDCEIKNGRFISLHIYAKLNRRAGKQAEPVS